MRATGLFQAGWRLICTHNMGGMGVLAMMFFSAMQIMHHRILHVRMVSFWSSGRAGHVACNVPWCKGQGCVFMPCIALVDACVMHARGQFGA
jgi:hypothetical protein